MPVTIKTVALRYKDQSGTFQEADCLKGTDATVTVISSAAASLTLQPYPVTYDFGLKSGLTVNVSGNTRYMFMFKSPEGAACNLTINGVEETTGDTVEAGKTSIVEVWNGIAFVSTYNFGELPAEYTRKDFILTSGHDARMDTGVAGNNDNLTIELETEVVTAPSASNPILGNGVAASPSAQTAWLVGPSSNVENYCATGNTRSYTYGTMTATDIYVTHSYVGLKVYWRLVYTTVYFRTQYWENTVNQGTTTLTKGTANIAIGAGGVTYTGGSGSSRIYYVKIKDGNNLIRHYVPCVRNADSKAGFYDLVNRTFSPSIGSAEFAAGNLT